MKCNRNVPTSHRHSNRFSSALLTVCLLRLPPLSSLVDYPRGIVARTLLLCSFSHLLTE